MSQTGELELRFLGEMEALRGSTKLDLPPSRKTRALLAYIALTGRSHRRDRLCSLLWDVADDPRGALRWSLSRLRAVVDDPDRPRIRAPGDSVAFEAEGARIDVLDLRQSCAAGLEGASLEELTALASKFRGELLEGLDLGDFLDFQAWCVAEREEVRKLHARVLRALVGRLAGDPEAALPPARTLAAIDPLDETARAGLVRLLAATGRRREAQQQYEAACRLRQELGAAGSAELEAAWRGARDGVAPPPASRDPEPASPPLRRATAGLVGRQRERDHLEKALQACRVDGARVLLLTGEPGLGKSRLLDELRHLAVAVSRADGRTSTVARLVAPPVTREGRSMVATVYGYWEGLDTDGYHWHWGSGAAAGAIPTNGGLVLLFASVSPRRFAAEFRDDVPRAYRRVLEEVAPDLAGRLPGARLVGTLYGFTGQPGYVRRSWGPGWALVGDAGYFKDPITAHGISDALRDAELVARAVARGGEAALSDYEARRDELSRELFETTEAVASLEWDTARLKSLHQKLSDAMKREVAALLELPGDRGEPARLTA